MKQINLRSLIQRLCLQFPLKRDFKIPEGGLNHISQLEEYLDEANLPELKEMLMIPVVACNFHFLKCNRHGLINAIKVNWFKYKIEPEIYELQYYQDEKNQEENIIDKEKIPLGWFLVMSNLPQNAYVKLTDNNTKRVQLILKQAAMNSHYSLLFESDIENDQFCHKLVCKYLKNISDLF